MGNVMKKMWHQEQPLALASAKRDSGIAIAELKQFADRVTLFSSQYSNNNSVSYAAHNLRGEPSIYPAYGDFTQAFVLRTYGVWWLRARSARQCIPRQAVSRPGALASGSDDFVDLHYGTVVYPLRLDIYETYNPGAVVRILGCERHQQGGQPLQWHVLWAGEAQTGVVEQQARIFQPPLNIPPSGQVRINTIRLEFNSRQCQYYTELDAVALIGTISSPVQTGERDVSRKVSRDAFRAMREQLSEIKLEDGTAPHHHLQSLPSEILSMLLAYLDTCSLCKLAQTCHAFHSLCSQPYQWRHLSLKPFWHSVTHCTLSGLRDRCSSMQSLDLSWCGPYSQVNGEAFTGFITNTSSTLTTLYLSACDFITGHQLTTICYTCTSLINLDLSSCINIREQSFAHISRLLHLRYLNLYRTGVNCASAITIVSKCTRLEVLNLGVCSAIHRITDLVTAISSNVVRLQALDLWRFTCLSVDCVPLLNSLVCGGLVELDIGWCTRLMDGAADVASVIPELVRGGRSMRKLFLTALRSTSDSDLRAIADECPHMEQLDILGTNLVTVDGVQYLLDRCSKLTLLDVSFCRHIDFIHIKAWNETYPNLTIVKSYQN